MTNRQATLLPWLFTHGHAHPCRYGGLITDSMNATNTEIQKINTTAQDTSSTIKDTQVSLPRAGPAPHAKEVAAHACVDAVQHMRTPN